MSGLGEAAVGTWLLATGAYAFRRKAVGDLLTLAGVVLGIALIAMLWSTLNRPPLRTLGETRWWFAVASPAIGILMGWRFDSRLFVVPACLIGATFAGINLAHPEYMDQTLMPALQSAWFVPHVVLNLLSYSALGLASLVAAWILMRRRVRRESLQVSDVEVPHKLVIIGLPLLTCGLCFGAFWAKEAWGHYWSWDPKETWAFVTWSGYLAYLHVRIRQATKPALNLWLLIGAFIVLLVTWFGVSYMPTAQDSVHTYAQQ